MSDTRTATRRTRASQAPSERRGAPRAAASGRGEAPRRAEATRGTAASRGGAVRTPRDVLARISALGAGDLVGRLRVPLVVAAALIVLVVALYGPARGLYAAWRENGTLQTTLDAENQTTQEYQSDVDALLTEDGIKDEARKKGYVGEGEKSIVVEGETGSDDGSDAGDADSAADDADGSDAADDVPWYLRVADFIFQYSEEQQ